MRGNLFAERAARNYERRPPTFIWCLRALSFVGCSTAQVSFRLDQVLCLLVQVMCPLDRVMCLLAQAMCPLDQGQRCGACAASLAWSQADQALLLLDRD
jgi:hypothetical protein